MLAIRDLQKRILFGLLTALIATLVSCASEKDTRLVKDPDQKPESTIPWNRQEKWEAAPGMPENIQGR
jgi:hypothetical protein